MKPLVLLLAALPSLAHAESFFEAEIGLGTSVTQNEGDGRWVQYGVPHQMNLVAPAVKVGVVAHAYRSNHWGIDLHLDAVYMGDISASCVCVPDANYNPHTHTVTGNPPPATFQGHGNEYGVLATAEPFYENDSGWRFGLNVGAYAYRQVWYETISYPQSPIYPWGPGTFTANHHATWRVSPTAGISISKGHWSLDYQFLVDGTTANPNPGLAKFTHLITMTYRF